ncbi:hypothetical protein M011DRAFT_435344 [Sporormia fimetaria CBS 119925]|uniref:RNA recognition motif-containing protein n=1 Tax=Sporormia fimetaria CBS 119925 TaxID=1340428 RepID=A0A6A6VQF1_9PLEO|nr:hypothetical protein M011DRAFT_435344 [Sporormia fimetaria CBS 119925]
MPPQQGEVSLLTLFADVHYYYGPPAQKPPHHRFDKSSYVYLYHNPIQQKGRIEIANHAGTPEQDAFAGLLDTVKIEQTYKHPCLFTLTVDGFRSQGGSGAPTPQQDMSHWHLPTWDPRGEAKYNYRLHTVDLYFWTPDDATMFLDSLRRVLQPHQLQIVANPHVALEHKTDVMNPVVARLEKAAISRSTPSPANSASFPGPPSAPTSGPPPSTSPPATGFAPIPYNPAAPAAPEPISHREKTPPPPDAADGTGLNAAIQQDHRASQYVSPFQTSFAPQSTSGPYVPGPPSRTQTFSGPPTPGIQRQNTTGSLPPPPQSPPSFAPPPAGPPPSAAPTQQYASYASSTPSHPGVHSPGYPPAHHTPLPSPGFGPGQPQQQYQPLASPPVGGYGQYQYGSTSQQVPGTAPQLYRPTEHEAGVDGNEPTPAARNSNIGRRAEKVEKGVGKFLKKLDKKF